MAMRRKIEAEELKSTGIETRITATVQPTCDHARDRGGRYRPHQGAREKARRLRQMAAAR